MEERTECVRAHPGYTSFVITPVRTRVSLNLMQPRCRRATYKDALRVSGLVFVCSLVGLREHAFC